MKDTDLKDLTLKELFYLRDEWNLAYAKLKEQYKELELIHATLAEEFKARRDAIAIAETLAEKARKASTQIDKKVKYKYGGQYCEAAINNLH